MRTDHWQSSVSTGSFWLLNNMLRDGRGRIWCCLESIASMSFSSACLWSRMMNGFIYKVSSDHIKRQRHWCTSTPLPPHLAMYVVKQERLLGHEWKRPFQCVAALSESPLQVDQRGRTVSHHAASQWITRTGESREPLDQLLRENNVGVTVADCEPLYAWQNPQLQKFKTAWEASATLRHRIKLWTADHRDCLSGSYPGRSWTRPWDEEPD